MKQQVIYVIGGGASGMMAAIGARRNGAEVTILERNSRIGKKILATGNGRCNYSNLGATKKDYNHPEFVDVVFDGFGPAQTLRFFESLGIVPRVEDLGKVYPMSEQASSILDVLLYELEYLGVSIVTEALVQRVIKKNNQFTIFLADGRVFDADKVILSTGGKAMPKSGSDGRGYAIAESLGHHTTHVFPALVKLTLESPYLKHLDGVKYPGTVDLIHQGEILQSEFGDILFTKYGISGPTILQLSRKANAFLTENKKVSVVIHLVETLQREDIKMRFEMANEKPVDFSLIGLINKRFISALLKEAGIEKHNTLVKDLKQNELNQLIRLLFDWEFQVTGFLGFDEAQVTAGGIEVSEIDPTTMESRIQSGLFFTGELIDIDGLCGGYNLQWAWSSGYLAGLGASGRLRHD
ncbi:MAG: NAD(P)/FAD-dependent oxidoreductase [Firmicutes bacterium]|nr:NAD(P)/FAD-dependent oxidoreductase [Bacillota bacterium]